MQPLTAVTASISLSLNRCGIIPLFIVLLILPPLLLNTEILKESGIFICPLFELHNLLPSGQSNGNLLLSVIITYQSIGLRYIFPSYRDF